MTRTMPQHYDGPIKRIRSKLEHRFDALVKVAAGEPWSADLVALGPGIRAVGNADDAEQSRLLLFSLYEQVDALPVAPRRKITLPFHRALLSLEELRRLLRCKAELEFLEKERRQRGSE